MYEFKKASEVLKAVLRQFEAMDDGYGCKGQHFFTCHALSTMYGKAQAISTYSTFEIAAQACTRARRYFHKQKPKKIRRFADVSGGWWAQNERGHAARRRAIERAIAAAERDGD